MLVSCSHATRYSVKIKNNDYILALFNAIEEDDKYSMKFVNSQTIPENMGAERCTTQQ